ncbi:hypothetical protein EW142_08135 [Flagellimonas allohymeniacidonis]|uniref:Uncharacterized protein n=2 Tax=Flagellimonas allohymeniacidonis TaxID=2517819 RepID=A0A4Q8QJ18_9FLAO|nr:hypothetical protein EW142_08135 [Allomuricauda hymeniacidonis]
MSTKKSYKYIEWLSPDEMHEASLGWLSEMLFCEDEQKFLNNLIQSYTLSLTDRKVFEESKKIVTELSKCEERLTELIEQVRAHERLLKIMLDKIDQLKMEKAYIETHNDLTFDINHYLEAYRDIKQRLFQLLSKVMKSQKQKRLLN